MDNQAPRRDSAIFSFDWSSLLYTVGDPRQAFCHNTPCIVQSSYMEFLFDLAIWPNFDTLLNLGISLKLCHYYGKKCKKQENGPFLIVF